MGTQSCRFTMFVSGCFCRLIGVTMRVKFVRMMIDVLGFSALLGTAVLLFITYRQRKNFETFYSAVLLDPYGLNTFSSASLSDAPSGKTRVVFLGDSRIVQWPTPTANESFEFINRGIDAQTSVQVNNRYQAHVTPLQPDYVVVQVGINDLRLIPKFPEQKETIIANCKANIQAIVEQAREENTAVILTTIFPTGTPPIMQQLNGSAREVNQAIEGVNLFIQTLAAKDTLIIETENVLTFSHMQDYLHIRNEGYMQLNRILITLLISNQ